jgi:uncharacterized protein (DUF1697 family)
MAKLKQVFRSLGYEDARTYIQSGHVVFTAPKAPAAEAIEEALGFTVMVRSATDLRKILAGSPFPDTSKVHVVFLGRTPKAAAVKRLDPQRSPGDALSVRGREIYLSLPNGIGRSKLGIDWFERPLGVRATARNWRTVTKLVELADSAS